MAKERKLRLSRYFQVFVEDQIASGKYSSETAVIEEALRLLEQQEAKLEALRQALIAGEQSGEPLPFDMETWLSEQDRLDAAA